MRHLNRTAIFSLPAALILAFACAHAQQAESRYIAFDLDACTTLDKNEAEGWIIDRCNDDGDYAIYIAEGDLRYYVGYGPNGLNQRAFSQTLTPFNRTHDVVELRTFSGADEPHAAILRYFTESGMGDDVRGEVLVVTKLYDGEACHMAYIDARANPNANELARETADGGGEFDCAVDEPQIVGETGVSPM